MGVNWPRPPTILPGMGSCELENLPDLIAGFSKISGYCSNMRFIMKSRYELFLEDENDFILFSDSEPKLFICKNVFTV